MVATQVSWPDIAFGPVNLFSLPPAWFFYMSAEEKQALLKQAKFCDGNDTRQDVHSVH